MKKIITVFSLTFIILLVSCSSDFQKETSTEKTVLKIKQEQDVSLTYIDPKYNFSMVFPADWKGFTFENRVLDWGELGTCNSVDFGFAEQNSLFNISTHPIDQWLKISSEDMPKPTYIIKTDKYVFAYTKAQGVMSESLVPKMDEIDSIIKTFKLK